MNLEKYVSTGTRKSFEYDIRQEKVTYSSATLGRISIRILFPLTAVVKTICRQKIKMS